jgi:acyl-coenzyme A thioesterase PaaI-like protein
MCKMKKLTEALRVALSFAVHIPVGLRAQAGNLRRMKFVDTTKFTLAVARAALVLALIASPDLLAAQNIVTGGVTGTVTDPSGAVVAHATVTLKNPATGETNTASTNDSGIYLFSFLKPGEYTLTVAQTGFSPLNQSVRVLLGQTVTADLKIDIEKATANIEVTAGGTLLQTEDANITANVSNREIANIPNPGGDITYNAILTPGITGNTSSGGGFGNFSAFGLPGTSNLFTVNGNDYNDPFLNLNNSGASNLLLGSNEVEEVAVVVNGYTGQYGRQAGAQIDYSTKSGTNAFHGDAIYNWTGRALSANDFFNNAGGVPRPFENNNAWAAAFGGPIKKDKAFFFVDTEGTRYIFGTSQTVNVPTPALEAFTLANVPASAQAFYTNAFNLYNSAPGISRAVPVTQNSGVPATDPTFANSCGSLGQVPTAASPNPLFNPEFTTTPCLESFRTSVSNGNTEWLLTARVDYNFNDNNKVFGRVKFDRGAQPTYTDPINSAFNEHSIQPQNEGQLNYTHIFSPRVVNNFIFSDLSYSAIFGSPNQSAALALFPGNLVSSDTALTALGTGAGDFAGGFLFPQGRNVEQWQLVDDLSISRGKHNFKAGVNFRRDDVSDFTASELPYPAITTSLGGFASDSIDFAAAEHFALHTEQPIAFYSVGLYFQDEYHVRNNLKLTLALRADRNSSGVCQSNCTTLPSSPFDQLSHDPTIPYNQAFVTGQHSILPGVEKVVFQPRFGLAWSPFGSKTVIRAGVGLFTDLYPGTILDAYTTNFPQVTSFNLPSGSVAFNEAGSGATLLGSCNSAFQTAYKSGGTVGSFLSAAPAGCAVPNLANTNSKILNPKYVEWNLEIQHTLGSRTLLSANYVGNRGYDELLNNPDLNGFGTLRLPATAPDSRIGTVQQLTNGAYSNYNGVTVSAQESVWHGFTGRVAYTYSHALDVSSNGGVLPYSLANSILNQIDPFNPRASYASSDYDLRHSFNASYVWELPIKASNRFLNGAVGGWTVSGTFFWRSGFPFSVVDGNFVNSIAANNLFDATVLAQPVSGASLTRSCGIAAVNSATPCFTAAEFGTPTSFVGSLGRNAFRGPGYFNTDLSLRKNFKLNERLSLQLGANAYNVLNHPNFANPVANTADPSQFGQILSTVTPATTPYGAFAAAAVDARIVQVTGKITF